LNILVVGGGPGGLYFSYLIRRAHPDWHVRVVEQNAADSTFGFGVVFSDRALEFLRDDDPDTYARITPHTERWTDLTVVLRGHAVTIDGIGFAAIGRLPLLRFLQRQALSVGVVLDFEHGVSSDAELDGFDLVVGADGVNSVVRATREKAFGTSIRHLGNRFAWFGATTPFETLTQTFIENALGTFNAHHYRHSPRMSTLIFECDPVSWQRVGFATLGADETLSVCERILGDTLAGGRLVSNKSVWRCFPVVRNERWWDGNRVLLGDAQRTAHFSIGSGTRLAMEDAIALARALDQHRHDALEAFEAARRPIVDKLVAAADASGEWYERFPAHMRLSPREFAWSYIQRSGRIDPERLRKTSPRFVDD
jgi:2-polyprenyl-6-methoxyphenol hydroxylase-like FAD-dependent oxidoreductase